MMPKTEHDPPWTHAEVRAWVERHGGNVSAAARRLRTGRSMLQTWLADPERSAGARTIPPPMQRLCEVLDEIAALEKRLRQNPTRMEEYQHGPIDRTRSRAVCGADADASG